MTQYVINIGAIPNDGTGDPLRTAFNETNLNFDQVFAAGPVLSNIQIANNKILTTNTNGNLVLAPNGTGVIQANVSIVPNLANLRNLGSATNRWATVYSQYLDISGVLTTGDLTVNGNLTVTGNTIQIGNIVTDTKTIQLANTASNASSANGSGITVGANDNLATILYNSTSNVWTTNIGLSSVGNISAPYLFGNGSQLTGLPVQYGNANVVTLLAGFGSNTISTTGNITGGFIFGNISQANGFPATYGNANVATFLANFGSNTISTTGNITSNGVVRVNTLSINQTANVWVIAGNTITAPSGATWTSNVISKDEYINSALDGYINMSSLYANGNTASQVQLDHGLAQIIVNNGVENIWAFEDTGTLVFPASNNGQIYGGLNNDFIITTANANAATYYFTFSQFGDLTVPINLNVSGNAYVSDIMGPGNGNVTVTANTESWLFETDGRLFLPNSGVINASGNSVDIGSDDAISLEANAAVNIYTDTNGTAYQWQFGDAGELTLPFSSEITEVANPGGFPGYAMALAPDVNNAIDADQQLLIYPTGGADNNHLHLTSGNLYNTELFLGNDSLYVRLANTGNVVINSNDDTGNSAQWTFNTAGTTIFPTLTVTRGDRTGSLTGQALVFGDSTQEALISTPNGTTFADSQRIVINPGAGAANTTGEGGDIYLYAGRGGDAGGTGGDIKIRGGLGPVDGAGGYLDIMGGEAAGNGVGGRIDIQGGESGNSNGGDINITGGQGINGGDINILGGTGTAGPGGDLTLQGGVSSNGLAAYGNVVVNAGASQWQFDNTGNLRLPSNTFAVNYANGTAVALGGSYGNANVATFLAAYGSNTITTTGNITGNYFIGNGSQLTGISGNIANITANVISFNTAAGINVAAGQMAWNSSDGTLDIGLSYADVVLQVGQETHYVVRNDTGNIIENGTAVYCSGVTAGSGRIEASPMTGSTDPVKFLGLATQDISNGVNGVITYFGYVRGLDTRGTANTAISVGDETWAVGDQLYVHPTAAGKLTNVEPAAPNVKICVASILIRNQTSGVLFVRPTTNLDMVDLSDVQITTPAANQFLVYAGNRWENTALDISLDTTPTLGGNLAGAGFNVSNVGNISATGNITAQNFTGNINITGNVQGTTANVTLVAGLYSTVFDNTGNLTLPGNTFSVNYANNTPVDVVTRFESFWTVPVGNSTQSFTVSASNTYYMWVDCNIPNGILTWNATGTVTNTNVPVVGAQYAWVYTGGGTPIDFTSIPDQFVGTANTIVRSNVAPSATTNRFDFGINNASGGNVTVRYGWIQIS